jgi:autotransporter translocation and assembly factor TamB
MLVVILLVLAGGWFLVQSDFLRARVRTLVEAQLQDLLSRPVRVGTVVVSLAPLSAELRDVVVPGARPGDRPFAVIPRLLIEGDLTGLRKPSLHLRTVQAEGPRVFIERFPDGSDNIPRLRPRPTSGGEARFTVTVDSLSVHGGVFELAERRTPIDLKASAVRAELVGLGGFRLNGQLVAQEVVVGLPGARPYPLSIAARATLDRGRLEVRAGRLAGADLLAQAEGDVLWGERQDVAFRVQGDLTSDLFVHLGYITDQVRGGFHLAGDVHWTPEDWGYAADVRGDKVRVLERDLEKVRGHLTGNGESLTLDIADAGYRGGKVSGTLHVDLASKNRPTRLDLQVERADVAGALLDQGIPIEAVSGVARGRVSYAFDFTAAERGSGSIDLQIAPTEERGRLPVSGTVPLRLEQGVLRADSIRIDAPGQKLTGSGSFDIPANKGRFEWSVETEDPARLAVLLPPQEGGGPRLWWPSAGQGVISGVLELGAPGTAAQIELALENVRSPGASGDRLEGALRVTERAVEGLDLRLSQGSSTLEVRGAVPLGSGAAASGLEIGVEASDWPLAEARPWLPDEVAALGIGGRFSGDLALRGSTENPAGSVRATLAAATLGALELGTLRAAFTFDADALRVQSAALAMPAGEVDASGVVGLRGGPLEIALRAPSLRLGAAPFDRFLGDELDGQVSLEATLGGTLEAPRGDARVVQSRLTLGGRPLAAGDSAELRLAWDGHKLDADGSLFGLVAVDGGGAFDLERADLRFVVASDQLRTLADAVVSAALPEFTGRFVGELGISGKFSDTMRMALRLDQLEIGYREHTLRNLEPAQARIDGDGIVIDSLYVGEGESEFFLAGRIGLGGARPLDLKAQVSLPATWLGMVAPSLRATGSFDALATVRGTADRPEVNGEGGLRDGRVILLGFPHSFDDLRATVLFYPDSVVLDGLSTRLGGGLLQANGRVDLPAKGSFTYRFQATARDVTLRYPEGWLVRGGGDLTLVSTEGGRQVSGALDLDRAYYLRDIQLGLAQMMRSLLARQRLQVAETDEVLSSTQLNLALRIPGGLRVRNNLANLRGSADLLVRGSLARPVVFGRVEAERGGTVVYAENEYKVERAILSFANPYRIEPVVDLVAKTEVSSYQVTLNLSGPLDRLRATFASDPAIPDLEVLSLLATGDPGRLAGELTPEAGQGGASQGAESFLAGQAANLIGQRVGTLFGLDKFRVAPLAAGGDVVSSVRLTVGKRLRRNLLLTYSVDPSATQDQFLTVEWRLNQNLFLLFTQNGDGSYAVDAKWEKAF